jgi:hypothetical protein
MQPMRKFRSLIFSLGFWGGGIFCSLSVPIVPKVLLQCSSQHLNFSIPYCLALFQLPCTYINCEGG